MINRLSTPNQANFSTVNGIYPYESGYTQPITMIRYYDTVYNVNNAGINVNWYNSVSQAQFQVSTVYSAVMPVAKFYYANGVPPFYGKNPVPFNWAARFSCKFYAPINARYSFYTGGNGYIPKQAVGANTSFFIDNRPSAGTGNVKINFSDREIFPTGKTIAQAPMVSTALSKGWHTLDFTYTPLVSVGSGQNEIGFIAMWQTDSASFTPEKIPLSAGVCCPISQSTASATNGETIPYTVMNSIISTDFSIDDDRVATLEFEVPFVSTAINYNVGYTHSGNALLDVSNNTKIKEFRKVEYYEGYRTTYPNNYAINFSNASNSRIKVATSASFNLNNGVTTEAWIKTTNANGQFIIDKAFDLTYAAPNYLDWGFYTNIGGLGFRMRTSNFSFTSTVNVSDGNWHHVVFTADGSRWKFYIDGVLYRDQSNTNLPFNGNNRNLYIGGVPDNASVRFVGLIDEPRIYNRALTQQEITDSYHGGYGRPANPTSTQIKGAWSFNEGSGTVVSDYSGNGNTGTKETNAAWTNEGEGKLSYADEYVKKFSGQIKKFSNTYQRNGNDVIRVYCEDFSSFAKESFNLYSPTPIDYIQVGYTKPMNEGNYGNFFVDGFNKPVTFDGWDIHKFVQLMLTESFIDPYTFYKRKIHSNRSGAQIDGRFLLEYTGSTSNALKFNTNVFYGNPNLSDGEISNVDSKYIYPLNTGDFFYDAITDKLQPFYLRFSFNENGYPVMESFNTPSGYVDNTQFNLSGGHWSSVSNSNAFRGSISSASNTSAVASAYFTGTCSDIFFDVSPRAGSSNALTPSVTVELRYGNTLLSSYDINLRNSTSWSFYNGIDPNLGYNPCVFRIGEALTYDTYKVYVKPKNGYSVKLDGLAYYDVDRSYKNFVFNSNKNISDLDVERNTKDTRNEVYVYGALQGNLRGFGKDGESVVINPNNPVFRYNNSLAKDVNSVYDPSSDNYVGRPLRVLIQDPQIFSEEQADYVAFNVLSNYRNPVKNPDIQTLGNPLIQIGDCIAVQDNFKKYVSSTDSVWVTSIRSQFDQSDGKIRYLSKFGNTPIKPPTSFYIRQTQLYTANPIKNVKLKNNGGIFNMTAPVGPGASSVTFTNGDIDNWEHIPSNGYFRLNTETEVIPNNYIYYQRNVSGTTCKLQSLTHNCMGSRGGTHPAGEKVFAVDPYMTEQFGQYPSISFDLMEEAFVQVKVYSDTIGIPYHIATLTGAGQDNYPFTGWDQLTFGKYNYYWDMCDHLGQFNSYVSLGEVAAGGYYVADRTMNQQLRGPLKHSEFYFVIEVVDFRGRKYSFNTRNSDKYNKYVYTKRAPMGIVACWFSTPASLYQYWNSEVQTNRMLATANPRSFGKLFPSNLSSSHSSFDQFKSDKYVQNAYIKNQGVTVNIKDFSYDVDTSGSFNRPRVWDEIYFTHPSVPTIKIDGAARDYRVDLNYNVLTYFALVQERFDHGPNPFYDFGAFSHKLVLQTGKLTNNSWNKLTNTKVTFNPKNYINQDNQTINFLPFEIVADLKTRIIDQKQKFDYAILNNYIFITGNIYDRSGRSVFNVLAPQQLKVNSTALANGSLFSTPTAISNFYNVLPGQLSNFDKNHILYGYNGDEYIDPTPSTVIEGPLGIDIVIPGVPGHPFAGAANITFDSWAIEQQFAVPPLRWIDTSYSYSHFAPWLLGRDNLLENEMMWKDFIQSNVTNISPGNCLYHSRFGSDGLHFNPVTNNLIGYSSLYRSNNPHWFLLSSATIKGILGI